MKLIMNIEENKKRKKEKWRFCCTFGLAYGIVYSIGSYLLDLLFDGQQYEESVLFNDVADIIANAIFWTPFGILLGLLLWRYVKS